MEPSSFAVTVDAFFTPLHITIILIPEHVSVYKLSIQHKFDFLRPYMYEGTLVELHLIYIVIWMWS